MTTQQEAIDLIDQGHNVFLSGPGGTGKTYVINQITNNKTVIAAPTGIAALHAGGETCHSLFGLPYGLVTAADRSKYWHKAHNLFYGDYVNRLILDEISMARADYLDLIDHRLRVIRKNELPFGGIQTIVVGDFFQLSPIIQSREKRYFNKEYDSPYAFDSRVWKIANFKPAILSQVYRQSDEKQVALLNSIRTKDKYWRQAVKRLNEWCGEPNQDIHPLTLCNYLQDAQEINTKFFEENPNESVVYTGEIQGKFKVEDCTVDKEISLKEGCKIILCANDLNKQFKNGQRATVTYLAPAEIHAELENTERIVITPVAWERFKYSKKSGDLEKIPEGTFTQMPVRLGYAVSVHKAQGLTLESAALNLGKESFTYHQTYVALSRVKDIKNITLTRPITKADIKVDERVREFYANL